MHEQSPASRMRLSRLVLAVLCAVGLAALTAHADVITLTWQGPADGAWDTTTANWMDADANLVVWVQGADAVIPITGIINVAPGIQVRNLTAGSDPGPAAGEYDFRGGSITITGDILQLGSRKVHWRSTNFGGDGMAFIGSMGSQASEMWLVRTTHDIGGIVALDGTGRLQLEGALPNAAIAFASGTTALSLHSSPKTLRGLEGVFSTNYVEPTSGSVTLILNVDGTFDYAGILRDSGTSVLSLTKSGEGGQTLSGLLSYTGGTTLNAGTLAIDGQKIGGGGIVINGGLLTGTGGIHLGEDRLILVTGGLLDVTELDFTLSRDVWDASQAYPFIDWSQGGSVIGTPAVAGLPDGWFVQQQGTSYVVLIPEPATLSLIALGGLVTLYRRRRA